MTLLTRLLLLVGLAVAPAVALLGYTEFRDYRARATDVRAAALRQVELVASEHDRLLESARQVLIALAALSPVRERDTAGCAPLLQRLIERYEAYGALFVADIDGQVLCHSASGQEARASVADQSYFQRAVATRAFTVGELTVGALTGTRVLPLALPVLGPSGELDGIVGLSLRLDWLTRYLSQREWTADYTLLLADRDANILVRLPDPERWIGQRLGPEYRFMLDGATTGAVKMRGIDGTMRTIAYSPLAVAPLGLYVGLGITDARAMAEIHQIGLIGIVLVAGGGLVALAIAWAAGVVFLRRPIAALEGASRQWSNGDYAARVALHDPGSELGRLASVFNAMAARLELREHELRSAVRAKNRLLAAAGHDLKQPLQVALMALERMRAVKTAEEQARYFERGNQAIHRLTAALDSLLAASRLELGGVQPVIEDFPLARLLGALQESFAEQAQRKGLRLRVVASSVTVRSDPDLLWTILSNIVGNAINYTDEGSVLVGCRRRGRLVSVEVVDTGVGIPPDQVDRIFEEFQRAHHRPGGFGLGLSIVKGTAQVLGVAIGVFSTVGRGSRFTVAVPIAAAG